MRKMLAAALCAAAAFTVAASELGHVSPPFTIKRAGEPALELSQYRGKIVALAFIHTTCPHCQNLTTMLIPMARDYAPKGVQFVECAFNPNAETLVPLFRDLYKPPFPVGWSDDLTVRGYLGYKDENESFYVPHMVFLDRRGVIRADYPGESDFFRNPDVNIRAELDRMLKAAAPASAAKKKPATTASAPPSHP